VVLELILKVVAQLMFRVLLLILTVLLKPLLWQLKQLLLLAQSFQLILPLYQVMNLGPEIHLNRSEAAIGKHDLRL
jgi:hypothetical protein